MSAGAGDSADGVEDSAEDNEEEVEVEDRFGLAVEEPSTFCSLSLVSWVTGGVIAAAALVSHFTKGRFESLIVSPPGNFSSSIALSLLVVVVSVAGFGAIGLKLKIFEKDN